MAMETGANCYFSKPFNIEKFKGEMDKIFCPESQVEDEKEEEGKVESEEVKKRNR